MTKSAHFGSNSSFGLSKAILVYSDGQQSFATMHQPRDSPDGGPPYLDAGEALTIDFLSNWQRDLGEAYRGKSYRPMFSFAHQICSFGGRDSNAGPCSLTIRETAGR